MVAVSYHDTINELQGLDWVEGGPFARPTWFGLLEQHGARPLLAVAREGNRAMALPLHADSNGLAPLTNWYAFTWAPLRTAGAPEQQYLTAIARHLARRCHRVTFDKLADEHLLTQPLEVAFRAAGWHVVTEPCDTNHILPVGGRDFATYLAARPGRLRTTLARKAKKVTVSISGIFDAGEWSAYRDIYADSWKPAEGDPALLEAFARVESAAGRYRLALAWREGCPVAAQFWTVDGTTAYIHKLAHRISARDCSPGTTLTAALLERVIDREGVGLVDFGTGDDGYKADWMEATRPRWRITCLRRKDPRNWPLIARVAGRTLVSRARGG